MIAQIVFVGLYIVAIGHCLIALYAIGRRIDARARLMRETCDYIAHRGPVPRHLLAYMGHVPAEPRKEWWWRYGR